MQLARFNPIGLAAARPGDPVYAGARDPREPAALRILLDTVTRRRTARSGSPGRCPGSGCPAVYAEHALFLAATGPGPRAARLRRARDHDRRSRSRAPSPVPGGWTSPDLMAKIAEVRRRGPAAFRAEALPVLREIFTKHATAARLAALTRLAGLPDGMITGRRVAVLARAEPKPTCTRLPRRCFASGSRLPRSCSGRRPGRRRRRTVARDGHGRAQHLADRDVGVRRAWRPMAWHPDRRHGGSTGRDGWLRRAATRPARRGWHHGRRTASTTILPARPGLRPRMLARGRDRARRGAGYEYTAVARSRRWPGREHCVRLGTHASWASALLGELRSDPGDSPRTCLWRHRPEPDRRFGDMAPIGDPGAGPGWLCGDPGAEGAGKDQPPHRAAGRGAGGHRPQPAGGGPARERAGPAPGRRRTCWPGSTPTSGTTWWCCVAAR